jgi:hypothetical protein
MLGSRRGTGPLNPDYRALLRRVDVPTLLVTGEAGTVSQALAQELQDLNPRLRHLTSTALATVCRTTGGAALPPPAPTFSGRAAWTWPSSAKKGLGSRQNWVAPLLRRT